MSSRATLLPVLFVSCMAHGTAMAQAAALAQWGLLGTWALDCAAPASRSNGRLTYEGRAGDSAVHLRDFGDVSDTAEILGAKILGDASLAVVFDFAAFKQKREVTFTRRADGPVRALSNRQLDGDYTIREGKFLSNGAETSWQTRCR